MLTQTVGDEDNHQSDSNKSSPWGENESTAAHNLSLKFEDSFVTSSSEAQAQDELKTYIPLDDSQQYLAGLEKKLARLQGKTLSSREKERKRLINALAKSKEDHAINLLNTTNETPEPFIEDSDSHSDNISKGFSAVNPQGTLGMVMRKCAPSQVALTSEELSELLKKDILGKAHEEIEASKDDPLNLDEKES